MELKEDVFKLYKYYVEETLHIANTIYGGSFDNGEHPFQCFISLSLSLCLVFKISHENYLFLPQKICWKYGDGS